MLNIPFKYDVSYDEYNRIHKWSYNRKNVNFNLFDHGSLFSPSGKEYRFYGKGGFGYNYGWGYRFYHNGIYRDICVGTLIRALMLGWRWLSDEDKKNNKKAYAINRWPDGNHFYVTDLNSNPINYLGFNKFNTYAMAVEAGENWAKTKKSS